MDAAIDRWALVREGQYLRKRSIVPLFVQYFSIEPSLLRKISLSILDILKGLEYTNNDEWLGMNNQRKVTMKKSIQ